MSGTSGRLDTLRTLAAAVDADVLLVAHVPDIRWAVGFSGSSALLAVTADTAHLVTDGRYAEQAAAEVAEAEIHVMSQRAPAAVAALGLLADGTTVAFQAEHVTVAEHGRWVEHFPSVRWQPTTDLLVEAVAAKDDSAIEAVRRAQAATCAILESVLPLIRPGVTEREIATELVARHLRAGASAMAFEPIVAAGARGALPHARASEATLQGGDVVVIDVGGVFDGYCSDLTRTVALGEPGDEVRRVGKAVDEARAAGIGALHAGVSGRAVDASARDVLAAAGLAEFFVHSLGHGVGLDVHEWPRLSGQVDHRIPSGATVTVEPGVYLPGRFGVRIEDLVVVRAAGAENLTPLPSPLVVLPCA